MKNLLILTLLISKAGSKKSAIQIKLLWDNATSYKVTNKTLVKQVIILSYIQVFNVKINALSLL